MPVQLLTPSRRVAYSALALGLLAGSGASAQPPDTTRAPGTRQPVYVEAEVDEPVRFVRADRPEYPPNLLAQSICGWANLSYVVDASGRAEPTSFTVLRTTDPAFGPSAIAAIRGAVFGPARRHGLPVRQRVSQRVSFNLTALGLGQCRTGGS